MEETMIKEINLIHFKIKEYYFANGLLYKTELYDEDNQLLFYGSNIRDTFIKFINDDLILASNTNNTYVYLYKDKELIINTFKDKSCYLSNNNYLILRDNNAFKKYLYIINNNQLIDIPMDNIYYDEENKLYNCQIRLFFHLYFLNKRYIAYEYLDFFINEDGVIVKGIIFQHKAEKKEFKKISEESFKQLLSYIESTLKRELLKKINEDNKKELTNTNNLKLILK